MLALGRVSNPDQSSSVHLPYRPGARETVGAREREGDQERVSWRESKSLGQHAFRQGVGHGHQEIKGHLTSAREGASSPLLLSSSQRQRSTCTRVAVFGPSAVTLPPVHSQAAVSRSVGSSVPFDLAPGPAPATGTRPSPPAAASQRGWLALQALQALSASPSSTGPPASFLPVQ